MRDGHKMVRAALFVFALVAVFASQARAVTYLDAIPFLAAAGAAADTVQTSPIYTAISQDAFGTYNLASNRGGLHGLTTPNTGVISGSFSCAEPISQCFGSYAITITFPYTIVGFGGKLNYFDQATSSYLNLSLKPVFDIPLSILGAPPYTEGRSPFNYIGFYGQTFAPTDTLTLIWQPGVPPSSADAFAGFQLTSAVVLVATPEPTTAALLIAAMPAILFSALGRRRSGPGPKQASLTVGAAVTT